jgi:hypothetical protein
VYSVGAVLWQLLTGKHPFAGADEAAVRQRMLAGAPALPGSVTPEVARLAAKAMHRSPMQRFASLTAFADALGELGAGRCAAREEIGRALSERFGDRIAARRAAMEPRVSGNAEWVPTLRPDGVTEADEPRVPRHGRALEDLVQVTQTSSRGEAEEESGAAPAGPSAGEPPSSAAHAASASAVSEPPASPGASGAESGAASSAPTTDRSPESRAAGLGGPESGGPESRSPQSKRSDGNDHFATALSVPAQPIGRVQVEEAKETVIVDEASLAADQDIPTQMGERDSTPPSSTLGERGSRIDLDAVVAEFAGRDEATVVRPRGKRSKKKRKAAKSSSAGTWAFALLCVAGIGIGVFVGTRGEREVATPPPAQPIATTLSASDTEPSEAARDAANEAQAPAPPAGAAEPLAPSEPVASAEPSGSASPSSPGEPAASAALPVAAVAPAGAKSAVGAAPSPTGGAPAGVSAAPRATGPDAAAPSPIQPKPAPKKAAPKPPDDNPY